MDINKIWQSESEIKEEARIRKENERMQEIKKAREDNLIQDTEVLAEMVMTSMMESMALTEQVELLKTELEELKNKDGTNGNA